MRPPATYVIVALPLLVATVSEVAAKPHPRRYNRRYVDHPQRYKATNPSSKMDTWRDHESDQLRFGSTL
jgi:hypothetical protein